MSLEFSIGPLYLILGVLGIMVISGLILMVRKGNTLSTKTLVRSSLLTALSIILTRFLAIMVPLGGLPALRLSFGEIPIIITGILFGPIAGGLSGAVADLLGVLINSQGGGFFPGFTLSSILWGVLPGLLYSLIKKYKRINLSYINATVIILLSIGVGKLFLSVGTISDSFYIVKENGLIVIGAAPIYLAGLVLSILLVAAFIIIPFIITRKYQDLSDKFSIDKIIFIVTISYITISLGLNTLWLSIMFEKGFVLFLPGRILAGLVSIPIHSIIIFILSKFVKHFEI